MPAPRTPDPTYHVLLIGVDDYADSPLGGCVNDIDAVQQILLGPRMGKVRDRMRIRRLASRVGGSSRKTSIPEQPATLANIHGALDELEQVSSGDRVFVYYAGHGARVEVKARGGGRLQREVLVPVDYAADPAAPRLLFDFELNARLGRIVARTSAVTVVLDCCHAAGVTRDDGGHGQRSRYLDLPRLFGRVGPLPDPANGQASIVDEDGVGVGVDDCHVVSACLNHELAKEDDGDGGRRGLFTQAFVDALAATPKVDLPTMTWARIWQSIQAQVGSRNPWQHPWMSGSAGREVFAGPPVDRDPGLPLTPTTEGCRVEAGTLAGITEGAVLAVYDAQIKRFPPLGAADNERLALLQVASADRAWAMTTPVGRGKPIDLPPGARGRLVKAGAGAQLCCGVIPRNAEIEKELAKSKLLQLVHPGEDAPVRLEQIGNLWRLTDDKHGHRADAPVLFALEPGELRHSRAVLEHYRAYSLPLRIARRAGDLPGKLQLRVLSCISASPGQQAAKQTEPRAIPSDGRDTYLLQSGDRVCFAAYNRSDYPLHVTLVNCAASGKVQYLGDQTIAPRNVYRFWANNHEGSPFHMEPPPGIRRCIDRLVAIGTTRMGYDLTHLKVDTTFASLVPRTRGGAQDRDIGGGANDDTAPIEQWTAAQVVIETCRS